MTKQGVVIDHCDSCQGVWLDKGELYLFSNKPKVLESLVERGRSFAKPSARHSPRSSKPMQEIPLAVDPGINVDYCSESGGLWFDRAELDLILRSDLRLASMAFDDNVGSTAPIDILPKARQQPQPIVTDQQEQLRQQQRLTRIAAGLSPLPNLALRSTTVLIGLYALLLAALIALVEFLKLPVTWALGLGVLIVVFQFAFGPYLMDWSLRWFYQMGWVSLEELPSHLGRFVPQVCRLKQMRIPRFGIIRDGTPNAFTYGHHPNNARVIVTQGILDLLQPEEIEAVVAHELGHAKHWDMLIMTAAQLVPLILYYIYRTLIETKGDKREKKGGAAIAIGAYVLYLISEFLVLWLSRARELFADRFSGQVTNHPNALASALVKIAYGMAGQEPPKREAKRERSLNLEAVGALGLFDGRTARALAVAAYSGGGALGGAINPKALQSAMRWDLWNPWAKYYELQSTHPLVANRLRYLSEQATAQGQEPFVTFALKRPESYWDEFGVDILLFWLPAIALLLCLPLFQWYPASYVWGAMAATFGAALLLQAWWSYARSGFPEMSVAALLNHVKVSAIRSIPCKLRGTLIGRGVPGLIWSEDFVLRDPSGIIFLDYRQPLKLWEFFFGLMRGEQLKDEAVEITGWYRRAPVPYVELNTLKVLTDGRVRTCYVYHMKLISAVALIAFGIYLLLFT